METLREWDNKRQLLWVEAWIYTAQSNSCIDIDTPGKWADKCLREFEQRFRKEA